MRKEGKSTETNMKLPLATYQDGIKDVMKSRPADIKSTLEMSPTTYVLGNMESTNGLILIKMLTNKSNGVRISKRDVLLKDKRSRSLIKVHGAKSLLMMPMENKNFKSSLEPTK